MDNRVSPITQSSRRRPGQSLEVRQSGLALRQAGLVAGLTFGLGLLVGNLLVPTTEIARFVLIGLIFALVAAAFVIDRALHRQWHAATLGREGEEHVGQALIELERDGARVLHDVRGPIGNIDHVIFHTSGIYAVETKTWSRPKKSFVSLSFDGRWFRRNGIPAMGDPVAQVIRGAVWLRGHLKDELGLNFSCRVDAVIVFPGWNVVVERAHPNARICSTGSLVQFIKTNEARQLSPAQVRFFAEKLEAAAR